MAFLDQGVTLEDILGQQAQSNINDIQTQYAKRRRQSVAQQAHLGRLRSGVSNYQAGDLAASEASDIGGVESALGSALGSVPLGDYSTQQEDARRLQLAELLGSLNKPSALDEALSALRTASQIGATYAAFA